MNESQSHDFVAIASVLNAAWEIQREYGQSNLDFLSEFVGSDGDDSTIGKGSVDIQRLHEKAKEYFLMAEAIRHQKGLCDHAFKNAIHWLECMRIVSVSPSSNTVAVKPSKDILVDVQNMLNDSLDEGKALRSLNAQFLAKKTYYK